MVFACCAVHLSARCECARYSRRAIRVRRVGVDIAVIFEVSVVFEIINGIGTVGFEPFKLILTYSRVRADFFGLSVACVNYEERIRGRGCLCFIRKYFNAKSQNVVVVTHCEIAIEHFALIGDIAVCYIFELGIVVMDIEIFSIFGNYISVGKTTGPVFFGKIVGELQCAVCTGKVCVGISETCKDKCELSSAHAVGRSSFAVIL